jgi:hypothetical protein
MGHANIDVTQNVYGKSWWEGARSGHPNRQRNRRLSCASQRSTQCAYFILIHVANTKGRHCCRPFLWCAEHVRQLEGESPFDNLMEVKS